jgi:hypothetical protein
MLGRGGTTLLLTGLSLVAVCVTACGGGSSSGAAPLPTPPGSHQTTTTHHQPGLVGRCYLVAPAVLHGVVDHSTAVPCSHRHNLETAGIHPVYSKLTKATFRSTVEGYRGDCGPDYTNYLSLQGQEAVRLWGIPLAMKRSDGSWVVRCDLYVQAVVGNAGPAVVTRDSLHAEAQSGHTVSWLRCTDRPPTTPGARFVDCSRPHAYEAAANVQTVTALKDVYPTPSQLRSRGTAVCRKAAPQREDVAKLDVKGYWTSKKDWVQQARPTDIYGTCWFSRRDHQDLPPEH